MKYKPYDYQATLTNDLVRNKRRLVPLKMGLSKTVCVLTAYDVVRYDYADAGNMLVIAPKKIVDLVWEQEGAKWDHLSHLTFSRLVNGAPTHSADIYLTNYEQLPNLVKAAESGRGDWLRWVTWVVLDESTAVKSCATRNYKLAKKITQLPWIDRVTALTGTPAPNNVFDLWGQYDIVAPGCLGSFWRFRAKYGHKDPWGGYTPRKGVVDAISKATAAYTAAVPIDQPDPCGSVDDDIYIDMPPGLYSDYLRAEALAVAEGDRGAWLPITQTTKLRQFCQGFMYVGEERRPVRLHTLKIDACLEAMKRGPALVLYQFVEELEMLKARLDETYTLDGKEDRRIVDAWNAGDLPHLIVHPKSAGYGLNLQGGGSRILWTGLGYNLGEHLQANSRLIRRGQTREVAITRLLIRNTIDTDLRSALARKESGQNVATRAVIAAGVRARAAGCVNVTPPCIP